MMRLNEQSAPAPQTLRISPQLDQINMALLWLKELLAQTQISDRAAFGLTLSLDEALTNIVTNADTDTADSGHTVSEISLAYSTQANGVSLRIEDDGEAFDPTRVILQPHAKSVEEAEIGGHGLRLMRQYLDSIQYERQGRRNVLTLFVS